MLGKPEYQAFPFKLCRRENWSEKTKNKNKDKKKKNNNNKSNKKTPLFRIRPNLHGNACYAGYARLRKFSLLVE